MPETTTSTTLEGCAEQIPMLGVTRTFDFGQFIELFDESGDPRYPGVPALSRIVFQTSAGLAADRQGTTAPAPLAAARTAGLRVAAGLRAGAALAATIPGASAGLGGPTTGEVHLFDLTGEGPGAKLPPIDVQVEDAAAFFESSAVEVAGVLYRVPLDDATIDAMSMGRTYNTFGHSADDPNAPALPLRITLVFTSVVLTQASTAALIAGGALEDGMPGAIPALTPNAVRTLLAGGQVMTHAAADDGVKRPVLLIPPGIGQEPAADSFKAFDLPSLFAAPFVLAKDGGSLPLDLSDAEAVRQLAFNGTATFRVGPRLTSLAANDARPTVVIDYVRDEASAEFTEYVAALPRIEETYGGIAPLKPATYTWVDVDQQGGTLNPQVHYVDLGLGGKIGLDIGPIRGRPPIYGGAGGGVGVPPPAPSMTDRVQPRLPSATGLPIAVFVPWQQTWALQGFSRGNLLNTIALAPQEEVTMQIYNWERRSRTLDQSSEVDISQETDISQSTRDTEDVFREMLAKHDFSYQLGASLDASYSMGAATISVGATGNVENTDSIQQTARNSQQSIRESTIKATSRVSSRRVTRVTQSIENGREERVTRTVRNPNQCHTLSLDFFETLARYEVKLDFLRERMRLVVLVPNPLKVEFTSETVRRNETALHNALLEPALGAGFDACRYVGAYDEAVRLVGAQALAANKIDDVGAQRDVPKPAAAPDPAAPQQAEVERVTREILAAIKAIHSGGQIDSALTAIAARAVVTEADRRKGQQWLFINFVAFKFPALLSTLDALSTANPPPADMVTTAQKILAVVPRADAPTHLGNLNQMSDQDKERAGIAAKLDELDSNGNRRYRVFDWDWAWWTGRMRDEGLYTANDGGLGTLAEQLQKAFMAWEAKKAQGDAMKDQDVAQADATSRQQKDSTDDKLSTAFPLEELAAAYERRQCLLAHLAEHTDFYNYVLFQSLPPSEQALKIIEATNGKLQVGLFEPRVVAMSGSRLVVPLTPLAGPVNLKNFLQNLGQQLETAFEAASQTPDTAILTTPGVSISSRLGQCSGCEEHLEAARGHELRRLSAVADQAQREADRRLKRLEAQDYGNFEGAPAAVRLELQNLTVPPQP